MGIIYKNGIPYGGGGDTEGSESFLLEDVELNFVNKVASISDNRISEETCVTVYYQDDSIEAARAANIEVETTEGHINFYAQTNPYQTIICNILAGAFIQSPETSAGNSALRSEGFAVGKQNGVEVDSESIYYHNNSKYFKEQADLSAQNAENSKNESEAWAAGTINGTDVPSSADQHNNNAKYYSKVAQGWAQTALVNKALIAVNPEDTSNLNIWIEVDN